MLTYAPGGAILNALNEYEALLRRLAARGEPERAVACLTSACIDVVVDLGAADPPPDPGPDASKLLARLRERAGRGVGGEFVIDWDGAVDWVKAHMPHHLAWGGTGPHAAMTLAAVGAKAVIALNDRSAEMLGVVPDGVLLATPWGLRPAGDLTAAPGIQQNVLIFEFTRDVPALGVIPPRSSRIIVRLGDLGIEPDAQFDALFGRRAVALGAGLVGGFQCVPEALLEREYARVARLAALWREDGAEVVHLELAGYETRAAALDALENISPHMTSLGMSESEFRDCFGETVTVEAMRRVARRYGLERLCVHADAWAASATRGCIMREREALMLGSLLAAARAVRGRADAPTRLPPTATLTPPPFADSPRDAGGHAFVSVPTLYLSRPRTTLGMGDTFTAGCLLALSEARQDRKPAEMASASRLSSSKEENR